MKWKWIFESLDMKTVDTHRACYKIANSKKINNMKTIITSSENNVNALFDKRFGRAAWFCIYDEQTQVAEFVENENVNAGHGAGTKTAEKVVELNATKVISGDFGPKAKELLEKLNVQMVILQDDDLTVQNIIDKLKK